MRTLRLDRNRNNLTRTEQDTLARQVVGVVGQSVGHAVAHTLALEGSCGRLRLADFDTLELTNLNRVPGTLFDIGVNKAVVTARRIAELDPYLPVEIVTAPLGEASMDAFLDGLTLVVEECDSLDVKLAVREAARRHRLPLIMQSSDRGLLDIERFDLDPARLPFHGLLGGTTTADLRGLSTRDKAPHVIRILDGRKLSTRLAASMVEIGETLNSWPQLGGDVQLGGASVAAAVRRIGLAKPLPSGRTRMDLEDCLDDLTEPMAAPEKTWPPEQPASIDAVSGAPGSAERTRATDIAAVLHCAQLAPSGGNAQPWTLRADTHSITISLASERSSAMDIGFRGSALALGAAWYNARVAAAALGLLGPAELRPRAGIGSEGMPRADRFRPRGAGVGQGLPEESRVRAEVLLREPPGDPAPDTPPRGPHGGTAPWPPLEGVVSAQRGRTMPWLPADLWQGPDGGAVWIPPKSGPQVRLGGATPWNPVASAAPGVLDDAPVSRPDALRGGAESGLRVGGAALLTAEVQLGNCTDSVLARDYSSVLARHTNRRLGTGDPIPAEVLDTLAAAAIEGGGGLRWITGRAEIDSAAGILGEAERIRCLTPRLHQEMFAELRGPGDDLRTGLDVRTLELAPGEAAVLEIARRADVMGEIRSWAGGTALGRHTEDQVRSGSAVAVVTFAAPPPADPYELVAYARAGEALQRVWARAQRHGLAVQPVSPVFLYARRAEELHTVSPEFADTLTSLQGRFLDLLGVPGHETVALVLRLGYAAEVTVRSRRLPVPDAETRG